MNFSYFIGDNCVINRASLPLETNRIALLTGNDTFALGLVGGIIARVIPIQDTLQWPQLQALIENYSGKVVVQHGDFPTSALYLSPDPERHLIFSKVKEELTRCYSSHDASIAALHRFDLNNSFYERHINRLSGGEKIKLALCVALSTNYDCYIFHGILPWLDSKGRELLVNLVTELKTKAPVLLIEHNVYYLRDIVDADSVYEFKGNTIHLSTFESLLYSPLYPSPISRNIDSTSQEQVVQFLDVYFYDYPYPEYHRSSPLLDHITFSLDQNRRYALVGDNGTGKSTISKILFRLLTPASGAVFLCGRPISSYTREDLCKIVCYIGQFPEQQIIYSTVNQYIQHAQQRQNDLAIELLASMTISPETPVSMLSPYDMKLMLLSSLITNETKVLVLDEPSWGLSMKELEHMLNLACHLINRLRCTLLLITHDTGLAKAFGAQTISLDNGQLVCT